MQSCFVQIQIVESISFRALALRHFVLWVFFFLLFFFLSDEGPICSKRWTILSLLAVHRPFYISIYSYRKQIADDSNISNSDFKIFR